MATSRVVNRPRLASLPAPPLSQAEVIAYLTRTTFDDVVRAGWLKAAFRRPGATGKGGSSVFYHPSHVVQVRERLLQGEYPGRAGK